MVVLQMSVDADNVLRPKADIESVHAWPRHPAQSHHIIHNMVSVSKP